MHRIFYGVSSATKIFLNSQKIKKHCVDIIYMKNDEN